MWNRSNDWGDVQISYMLLLFRYSLLNRWYHREKAILNDLWILSKSWALQRDWTIFTINPFLQVTDTSVASNMQCPWFILVSDSTTKMMLICHFNQWCDRLFLTRKDNFTIHIAKVIRTVHKNSRHSKMRTPSYKPQRKKYGEESLISMSCWKCQLYFCK